MDQWRQKEFEELSNNVRHWERMRWVSMTVFVAIMGAALTGYFSGREMLGSVNAIMLRLLGMLLVAIFWVQDERIVAYWKATRNRACEIEKEANVRVFSATPKRGLFSSGTAVRLLYALFLTMWIVLLFT